MKVEALVKVEKEISFLEIDVEPRYWEDFVFNGVQCDDDDITIWGRKKNEWHLTFDLKTGRVLDWIEGNTFDIYSKVCDAGIYYLLDKDKKRIFRRDGYVPEGVCHGDNGYGDYIIMKINEKGYIENYKNTINMNNNWELIEK